MRYCFVFGCPRSGTSALTRLLHHDDRVVMGMERYKYLLKHERARAAFSPDMFEPERFFDFREGDTNVTPTAKSNQYLRHYARAERRFREGTVQVVGDKIRAWRPIVSTIATQFPAPRFVFIYRELLRVANSFEGRVANTEDESWSPEVGYRRALERWNMAFTAAEGLLDRDGEHDLFLVRYERLFCGDLEVCRALFDFVGLDVTPVVQRRFRFMTSKWDDRSSSVLRLTPAQQAYLLEHADPTVLARFDDRFEAQLS